MRIIPIIVSLFVLAGCGADFQDTLTVGEQPTQNSSDQNISLLGQAGAVQVIAETFFKVSTAQSSALAANQKCKLAVGTKLTVNLFSSEKENHYAVTLKDKIANCSFQTGYLFKSHISATATPSSKRLIGTEAQVSAMYQSQIDNSYLPESTCGITSLTMAIRFFGTSITSNQMIAKYDYTVAQSNATMGRILSNFGLKTVVFNTATRAQLKAHIDLGRPIVLQNYFTRSGHIVSIVGYDDKGWIANDPYGDWLGVRGSYKKNTYKGSYYGRLTHYTFSEVEAVEGVNNYQGIAVYK